MLQDDSMLLTDKTLEKRIHGGGKIFERLSEEYAVIYEFQQRVIHEDYCELELPHQTSVVMMVSILLKILIDVSQIFNIETPFVMFWEQI